MTTIAVASGKGGVGKTWLAVTLGHALARLGRRVLLFDGDLGLANVDIQLGLDPALDLGAVVSGRCRLADAVLPEAPIGLDVLPGRSGSGVLAGLDATRRAALLAELAALARGYDFTLLDLPAGVDAPVRDLLAAADLGLVVTTDEPTALTDAYALLKVAWRGGAAKRFALVVNLAATRQAGQATALGLQRVCERFLGFAPPLLGVVRRDPRVAEAIRQQAPLLRRHPQALASRDVEDLARQLAAARP